MSKERKSTKNLNGGPMVYGSITPYGKARIGNSIPKKILEARHDFEFGAPSYNSKAEIGDVKNMLSNEPIRDQLINNIQKYLANEVMQEQRDARKSPNTKTSELRKELVKKQLSVNSGRNSNSGRAHAVTLDQVSRNQHSRGAQSQTRSIQK